MRPFYDIDAREFVTAPGGFQPFSAWEFMRGEDGESIDLSFVRGGVVVELPGGATGSFLIKIAGKRDGETLANAPTWTKTGSGETTVYSFSPDLSTAAINAALEHDGDGDNDVLTLAVEAQVLWIAGGKVSKTPIIAGTLVHDVNHGTEGVPTSGTPVHYNAAQVDALIAAAEAQAHASIASKAIDFDGTAGATHSTTPGAPGLGYVAISAFVNPASLDNRCVFGGAANALGLRITTAGALQATKVDVSDVTPSAAGAVVTGRWQLISYERTGTTGTYRVNGLSVGTATDANDYAAGTTKIGLRNGDAFFEGLLARPVPFWNAAPVGGWSALYDRGGLPLPHEMGASMTALNTASFANSSGGIPYSSFTGVSATGFHAVQAVATNSRAVGGNTFKVRKGQRFRLTYTLAVASGATPDAYFTVENISGDSASYALTAGTHSLEIVATTNNATQLAFGTAGGTTDYTISGISLVPVGVLAAPDDPSRYTLDQARATLGTALTPTGSWTDNITLDEWSDFFGDANGFGGITPEVMLCAASRSLGQGLKKGQAISITLTLTTTGALPVRAYLVGVNTSAPPALSNIADITGDGVKTFILVPGEDIAAARLAIDGFDGDVSVDSVSINYVGGIKDASGNGHHLILPAAGVQPVNPILP